jgi:hypothetical protein
VRLAPLPDVPAELLEHRPAPADVDAYRTWAAYCRRCWLRDGIDESTADTAWGLLLFERLRGVGAQLYLGCPAERRHERKMEDFRRWWVEWTARTGGHSTSEDPWSARPRVGSLR